MGNVTPHRVRPRLLDLFCGAGGAAVGYHRAGFDVIGVDIHPQPHYPFWFVKADALTALDVFGLAELVDCVHASPPCQRWSDMYASFGPDLLTPTRRRLAEFGLPYVIENVPQAPLRDPILLCGSMFDLDVKRHRLFETNWPIGNHDWPCRHRIWAPRYRAYDHGRAFTSRTVAVYGQGGGKAADYWGKAMGIDWMRTRAELAAAIPPAYTEWIGRRLLDHLNEAAA